MTNLQGGCTELVLIKIFVMSWRCHLILNCILDVASLTRDMLWLGCGWEATGSQRCATSGVCKCMHPFKSPHPRSPGLQWILTDRITQANQRCVDEASSFVFNIGRSHVKEVAVRNK
jgi:hypothetical protein